MSEVSRYNLMGHKRPDGQMVAYEDYEKLRAENNNLKQACEINRQVADAINDNGKQVYQLQLLVTKLTKQNEIMKKALEFYASRGNEYAANALQESEGVEKITITGAIIHGTGYVETKPVEVNYGSPPQGKITIEED